MNCCAGALRAETGHPVEMPGEMVAFGINGSLKERPCRSLNELHPPLSSARSTARLATSGKPSGKPQATLQLKTKPCESQKLAGFYWGML